MIVHCQFGHARYMTEGQLIEVYHNNVKLTMEGGDYLTPMSSRKTKMFYLKPVECKEGDLLKVDCKVGLRLLGEDEDRTFQALFKVDSTIQDKHFVFPKVGYGYGFPILKGSIDQISLITAKDKRLQAIKTKMEQQ